MKPSIVSLVSSSLLWGLLLVSSANAGAMTFFGNDPNAFATNGNGLFPNALNARTSFLSNLIGVGTETFESYQNGTPGPLSLSFPGAGNATLLGSGEVDSDASLVFGVGAISGKNWWQTSTGNNFSISFANPIAAFGFYGIDVGETGRLQLTLTSADNSTVNVAVPHPLGFGQNGAVFFFGYINTDNPWISVAFTSATQSTTDFFGFDDMTVGSVQQVAPVPEPGSIGIFACLSCALAWGVRRKSLTM